MELKKSKWIDPVLLHVRMPSYDALSLFQHFVLKTTLRVPPFQLARTGEWYGGACEKFMWVKLNNNTALPLMFIGWKSVSEYS